MEPAISSILFYLFGAMAIICAIAVIWAKNPVTSAMGMALSFVATAALYFGMGAQFLGIVQLIVYAGAILVLFLFIVMMLDVKAEEQGKHNFPLAILGVCIATALLGFVTSVALSLPGAKQGECPAKALAESVCELKIGTQCQPKEATQAALYGGRLPELSPAAAACQLAPGISKEEAAAAAIPDTKLLGKKLFSEYNIAFVILSFALLSGAVGAVAVGRKFRKD